MFNREFLEAYKAIGHILRRHKLISANFLHGPAPHHIGPYAQEEIEVIKHFLALCSRLSK